MRTLLGGLLLGLAAAGSGVQAQCGIPNARPPVNQRKFTSSAVESTIAAMQPKFKDPNLGQLFANTLPNTLDTTVFQFLQTPYNDTFVITGDITAMWLRDSANQVAPYLRFVKQDPTLAALIAGVIGRQARSILIDPFANAFQLEGSPPSPHSDDSTSTLAFAGTRVDAMLLPIFERKYEIDSLANFLHLSASYFTASGGDLAPFRRPEWLSAVSLVIQVYISEQTSTAEDGGNPPYVFQRQTSQPTDTLQSGYGANAQRTGMVKTAFRPSDDAHTFPFNVAGNAYASVALDEVAVVLDALGASAVASQARALAATIRTGIASFGILNHPTAGRVYAYEVDGYGNAIFMDDANVPSLLSLPYLGFLNASDPLYAATRAGLLSPSNPWYFNGSAADGIGGPHVGFGAVWPMSILMRALTSTSDAEIARCLTQLVGSSACTGLMHESFDQNSFSSYTRPWFAWANSLFGELILRLAESKPYLIFK